ncbi:SDR family NAD(P)-dependent oxidoreductase [Paenibacillus sp. y28]|uniref:SDR family NAD(P)-dependent oxidoreductase n=1 Tax=Paenibacillus sp. y28 TaxID=3129110 RepID=UPI003016B213
MITIKGLVVVITGASSGIGAEAAVRFAERGAIVVLMARSEQKLRQVAARIAGDHAIVPVNVADRDQVEEAMQQVIGRYGRIDVLINGAGFAWFEYFEKAPIDHFEAMMDVNYFGTVRCIKAVLPHMLGRGKGHIVNIASVVGKIGNVKSSAYAASKHAVLGLTNSLRPELRERGVLVSAVNPGPVATPFFDKADPDGSYVQKVAKYMLTPQQVADAIVSTVMHRRMDVTLPYWANLGAKLFHLFPGLFEKLMGGVMNKK